MNQPLSPEELGDLFQAIDNEPTGKLSELAKIAELSLAEDYIGADLSGADLSGDNLSSANLSNANLSNANLSNTNLSDANLWDANLWGANLSGANLSGANLKDANLKDANLKDADLSGAALTGACIESWNINSKTKLENVICHYVYLKRDKRERSPINYVRELETLSNKQSFPLIGKALLQKVKELSHLPRRETAKRCGYYTIKKNKQTRVNLTDFYDAVLAARGVALNTEGTKDGRGREPNYRVSVNKNGQIVIGSTYTHAMGLKPGDEFEIKLGYKHIHLKQIDTDLENTLEEEEEMQSWRAV